MEKLKNRKFLICVAVLLVLFVSTQTAMAYFSDYEHALGEAQISLTDNTVIKEEVVDNVKHIQIQNLIVKGQGSDVLVRVAVYGPDEMTVNPGANWEKHGDFYYYTKILPPGDENSTDNLTTEITASIEKVPVSLSNQDMEIIVVHESVPVVYDASGENFVVPDGWWNFH